MNHDWEVSPWLFMYWFGKSNSMTETRTKLLDRWVPRKMNIASRISSSRISSIVFQLEKLEQETIKWCREILRNSPTAIRVLKSALNAVDDGHAGLQVYFAFWNMIKHHASLTFIFFPKIMFHQNYNITEQCDAKQIFFYPWSKISLWPLAT